MLRTIFWKEWRETRLSIFLFVLLTLTCTVLQPRYAPVVYVIIWPFVAIVLAASLFSGERESSTLPFLLAIPVKYWKLWALKIAYGAFVLVGFGLFWVLMTLILDLTKLTVLKSVSGMDVWQIWNGGTLILILSIYAVSSFFSIFCDKSFQTVLVSSVGWLLAVITAPILFVGIVVTNAMSFSFALLILLVAFFVLFRWKPAYSRPCMLVLLASAVLCACVFLRGLNFCFLVFQWAWIYFKEIPQTLGNIPQDLWIPTPCILVVSGLISGFLAFGSLSKEGKPRWQHGFIGGVVFIATEACLIGFLAIYSIHKNQKIGVEPEIGFLHNAKPLESDCVPLKKTILESEGYVTPFSSQHLLLNREKGTIVPYCTDFPWITDFLTISPDNRWVLYRNPVFHYGVSFHLGIKAERVGSGEQYLLCDHEGEIVTGKWAKSGKIFVLVLNRVKAGSKILFFSMDKESPILLRHKDIDEDISFIDVVEKSADVYLYDRKKKDVWCFSDDLNRLVIKKIPESAYASATPNLKTIVSSPILSPDGKRMVFTSVEDDENASSDEEKRTVLWSASLADEISLQKLYEGRSRIVFPWCDRALGIFSSAESNLMAWIQRQSKAKMSNCCISDLISVKVLSDQSVHYAIWCGDGRHLLVFGTKTLLLEANPSDLTCQEVVFQNSDRPDIDSENFHFNMEWSPDCKKVILYVDVKENNIWYLDIARKTWQKCFCPDLFYPNRYQTILCLDNSGRVYYGGMFHIYRVQPDKKEVEVIY